MNEDDEVEIIQPTLLEGLKSLPRAAWILFVGTFVNKFGTFVMPFLALYLTKVGYTKGQAGIVLAAYGVGHFGAAAIGGYLADRIGRRKTITLSMLLAAVFMMALPFASSLVSLSIVSFLAGLSGEIYRPAASALLADLVPRENRITAFAAYRFCFNAGWALGPATAGLLAKYDYIWLFAGEAITCAAFGVVAWFSLPRGVTSETTQSGWPVALKRIIRDRGYLLVLASYLGISFVLFQMMTSLGVHVKQLGFSEADYGIILSLNGVMIVLLELPLTSITRRWPTGTALAVGYGFMAAAMVVMAFAEAFSTFLIGSALLTVGEMTTFPIAIAWVANRAPENMRGRYMGMVGFIWSIGMVIAPWSGMQLLEISPALLWLVSAAAACVAALCVVRLHHLNDPHADEEQEPSPVLQCRTENG